MPSARKTGVGGTVDAFNFIRRVAFPSTPVVVSIFAAIAIASAGVSLLVAGENLVQTLVFASAVFLLPVLAGELVNSALLLRKDRILDFRRLMGVEVISILPMGAVLLLFSIIGVLLGATRLWEDGFLIGLAVSLPVRFLTPMAMSSMSSWRKLSAGMPTALEERLLSLSTEGSIETKILSFSGRDSGPIASLVVSNFHPGPYRDMGSGGLPSELKQSLEETQRGVVQVPHGISSHKLNIVSHRDIDRLLSAARENYPSEHLIRKASSMIRGREGEAIVSCQAFGNVALLTITLAPEEMEDLPTVVSGEIEKEASTRGFEVLVIDAHNSLVGQPSITPLQAERIITAAVRVLDRLKALSQDPFKVGSANDALDSYGLKDGIGPGGLSVLVLKTESHTVSYITIDGNNMQQGLRDRIVQSVKDIGVSDAEVMTTDTHLVTCLVRSPLGYYPVGAALPTASFVTQITQTVQKAVANLEESSAGVSKFSLQMQVLGSETFQSITSFIGRVARQIGRSFFWIECGSFLLAVVILFVV